MKKIPLKWIQNLDTHVATHKKRGKFLSAASGMVFVNGIFYVIADDELHLASFPLNKKGQLHKIFKSKKLPHEKSKRKKAKPDLESLCLLKNTKKEVTLVAIPSGSTSKRTQGAKIYLNKTDPLKAQKIQKIDYSKLFKFLLKIPPELNIEGALIFRNNFLLAQRGNGKLGDNSLIRLNFEKFKADLKKGMISKKCYEDSKRLNIGKLDSHSLSITDLAEGSDKKIYFLGVAENSHSTYLDGTYQGSVIGTLDLYGKVKILGHLQVAEKPEGLFFKANSRKFYLVTDADDPSIPSKLYQGLMPHSKLKEKVSEDHE